MSFRNATWQAGGDGIFTWSSPLPGYASKRFRPPALLREAQASAGIDHEHIVTSSDFPFFEIFPHELDLFRD
jgi:hypothetical protein